MVTCDTCNRVVVGSDWLSIGVLKPLTDSLNKARHPVGVYVLVSAPWIVEVSVVRVVLANPWQAQKWLSGICMRVQNAPPALGPLPPSELPPIGWVMQGKGRRRFVPVVKMEPKLDSSRRAGMPKRHRQRRILRFCDVPASRCYQACCIRPERFDACRELATADFGVHGGYQHGPLEPPPPSFGARLRRAPSGKWFCPIVVCGSKSTFS